MDFQKIMKELVNPSHSPARSGKDLSHRKVLSLKAGELMPVLCEEMVPNDYFRIDTASLLRTFPLQTAAFVRSRIHFDFFFVPKTAIWHNWDRFYYQRNDHESSYLKSFAYEPNITLAQLNAQCYNSNLNAVIDSTETRAKLVSLLGYGNVGFEVQGSYSTGPLQSIGSKSLTLLPLAGYHRIYNMWYRNSWRDEPSISDSHIYSLDHYDCSSYATSLFGANTSPNDPSICQVHYHSWFSDLFMGSLPNQQFGSVSSVSVSLPGLYLVTNPSSFSDNLSSVWTDSTGFVSATSSGGGNVSLLTKAGSTNFDVLALRRALALQKWKEYNMRAGWKSRNQAKSMFGVSTPEDRKHEIEFLKGYEFPVMIDEVVNQSNTNLGELAGKGIGIGNGDTLEFDSGERHGYLYCIAYILPDAEYDALGIEKSLVRSEPFDHYVPAFENLGMEPIYKYELNASGNPTYFDAVLGYAPRYHEYKTRLDKVYGEFMSNGSLSSWVSVRRDLQGIANSGALPTQYFYVNPSCLDTVFAFSADGSLQTDQFILNCNFNFKAVRPMSDLGLPNL